MYQNLGPALQNNLGKTNKKIFIKDKYDYVIHAFYMRYCKIFYGFISTQEVN